MAQEPLQSLQAQIAARYRIERELGRGGMATVYLARDTKHDRTVALKILRHDIADLLGRERFLQEIEFTARLNHPNILPLYDSDDTRGSLYYVMPFVEGGTLRERLAHGPRPTLTEVLSVARQVAAGLDYAHHAGVVHRDVKPANLLISSGHVFIADFGVARAVREAISLERLTASGLVLGTPAYMAPEQLLGSRHVDGRVDQYGLAAVLYEMLAGEPPSHELTEAGRVARTLQERRPEVPAQIAAALVRALAREPAERFSTTAEFAAALEGTVTMVAERPPATRGRSPRRRHLRWVGPVVGAAAVFLLASVIARGRGGGAIAAPPDSSLYVVFPTEHLPGTDSSRHEEEVLHDALAAWTGITVRDQFQVRDALARQGHKPLTTERALDLTRRLGAGRAILSQASAVGDSVRVHAVVFDAVTGQQHGAASVRLAAGQQAIDSAFSVLADRLLFGDTPPPEARGPPATHSVPARQAFSLGQAALQRWALPVADSAFAAAGAYDPDFAEAHLWLALVRAWQGEDPARWRYAAAQAVAGEAHLPSRGRAIARTLQAQAHGDLGDACPRWQALAHADPADFVPWYGLADCLHRDDAVIPDRRSPSGWRFRASYHTAFQAYRRAFELLPSVLASFGSGASYESLRRLLSTETNALRQGQALPPDTLTFVAYPAWAGDTLAWVPWPADRVRGTASRVRPTSVATAVRRQRDLFHQIALTWAAADPASADAMQALAVSLEMLGDPAALDTLRRARTLARSPAAKLRVAGAEVWLLLKLGLAGRPDGVESARRLADSLLVAGSTRAQEPTVLAGLALLTGHAQRAAALLRQAARDGHWPIPRALAEPAVALLAFASVGGPADSLRRLEQEVTAAINRLPPAERRDARLEWLARSATLAFPAGRLAALDSLRGQGDGLLDLQAALAAGDTAMVRRGLERVAQARRALALAPGDISLDALLPEAYLLVWLGDDAGAAAWLDPALAALPTMTTSLFLDPARPATLVRVMALRANVAVRLGDSATARKWGQVVRTLWSDSDGFLRPELTWLDAGRSGTP